MAMMRGIMHGVRSATVLAVALVGFFLSAVTTNVVAGEFHEGLALHGDPRYPDGFDHFAYVNPDAPKGGVVHLSALGTFDTLNPFTLKGVSADGLGMVYATLMEASLDEPFSQYGLVAEGVRVAEDGSGVTYHLRPEARFADGTPITPDDVVFSFDTLRTKGHPSYRIYYRDVEKAEKTGESEVTFTFKVKGNAELPLIMGQLPVLPKHVWAKRDFAQTTLDVLPGSGPYRVADFVPGRSLTLERVKDWWGKDLPVSKGRYNFDRIVYDYYRDGTVALEAFLAGRYDLRVENIAKNWATAYTTPAVKSGTIRRDVIPNALPAGMQGFIFNTRRPMFQDRRVREALGLAFDFEWANRTVAYGAYTRTDSYFANSELAAHGLPSADELKLLEPYRGQIPDEVFASAYEPPKTDGSGTNRANLRKAADLLREAGWTLKDGTLVDKDGKPFRFEIINAQDAFERWVQPFVRSLERLGIRAQYRVVDSAQYQKRLDDFDFDMTIGVFPQSLSPGNEQRDFWGSDRRDQKGSRNLIGVHDPVVDALVDRLIHAPDRAALVTACRALDRVLLWSHYVIPQWHMGAYRVASWDMFGKPAAPPPYGLDIVASWWVDEAKAAALKEGGATKSLMPTGK